MFKFLLRLCCVLLIEQHTLASDTAIQLQKGVALVGGQANQSFYLQSKFHRQQYYIQVYLPQSPADASGYPVLYLLDGNASFAYASVLAQAWDLAAARSRLRPPLIVAIGYPTDQVFEQAARSFDYTPPNLEQAPSGSDPNAERYGGAELFYQFIQQQLKPIIAQHYAIDTNKQVLFGHSYGGLFSLYTFLHHPQAFQGYIAASPAIWWQDFAILKQLHRGAPQLQQATSLWLSVGALEQQQRPQRSSLVQASTPIAQFAADLPQDKHLQLKTVEFADLGHLEALFAAINLALQLSTTLP